MFRQRRHNRDGRTYEQRGEHARSDREAVSRSWRDDILTFLGCWAPLAHQESSQSTKNAASDEQFAKKAAQGGMAEVKMGELAEQKGTSEAVKKFGQRMAQDHTKADEELRRAAMKENMSLPTDLDTKDQATYDALAKLSGSSFDRAYARDMVKDHEQDIAEFKREANSGKNESIKNFAPQRHRPCRRSRIT
jgi:putative membrane protein